MSPGRSENDYISSLLKALYIGMSSISMALFSLSVNSGHPYAGKHCEINVTL